MKVKESTSQIRDFFNNSTIKKTNTFLKKNSGTWNEFLAALDTIDDSCLAIENFKLEENNYFIKNPYLSTYGILQALYMQQDAVNYLKVSLFDSSRKIDWSNTKYLELAKIRQVRNETIGHPVRSGIKVIKTKNGNGEATSCTIDRSTLNKNGFEYTLWMSSKTERKTINFSQTITLQDEYLGKELETILKELLKEEKQHKKKFANEKLSSLLKKQSLYQINLIYGVQWNDHLAWPSFIHYFDLYKKIRIGLEERYGKFGESLRIPGTNEVIKKLDFIFLKLETFKNSKEFENYELEVYIDALDEGLKELQTHLLEIDEEFKLK